MKIPGLVSTIVAREWLWLLSMLAVGLFVVGPIFIEDGNDATYLVVLVPYFAAQFVRSVVWSVRTVRR